MRPHEGYVLAREGARSVLHEKEVRLAAFVERPDDFPSIAVHARHVLPRSLRGDTRGEYPDDDCSCCVPGVVDSYPEGRPDPWVAGGAGGPDQRSAAVATRRPLLERHSLHGPGIPRPRGSPERTSDPLRPAATSTVTPRSSLRPVPRAPNCEPVSMRACDHQTQTPGLHRGDPSGRQDSVEHPVLWERVPVHRTCDEDPSRYGCTTEGNRQPPVRVTSERAVPRGCSQRKRTRQPG